MCNIVYVINQNKVIGQLNPKKIPFNQYKETILGYANQTFSTLHAKFLKEIWNDNKHTAKLHKNQCSTNWTTGTYEVYIPTRDSLEYNLRHYRIAIQILPEISNNSKHEEAYKLCQKQLEPLGDIDSELNIIIAPRQDKYGLVRGFKHRNKPGFFTGIFVNANPEIVWKRVLDMIANFIGKRLDGLMKKLGFEEWIWKWLQKKDSRLLYYIVERFSYVIRQSIFTFFKLHQHLINAMKPVLEEIGDQNIAKRCLRAMENLPDARVEKINRMVEEGLLEFRMNKRFNLSEKELIILRAKS
jgi:hypothetical protein